MDLRDVFEGLDAGASVPLAEAITDRLMAGETAARVCDELDAIIGDKLLEAVLD